MTKADLVEKIQKKAKLPSKAMANTALNGLIEALSSVLAKGDSVNLTGLGSFKVVKRAARKGRNPQTGKEIKIAACKVAKFTASKSLKEALNK